MFLVDTSVWIEALRRPPGIELAAVVALDDIVTCLPVIQEVLQGFREDRAYRLAREAMFAFEVVESPLRAELFEEAAQLYRAARLQGLSIRSGVDALIAACAVRNDLAVLHCDRDFGLLARVSPLKQVAV